MQARENAKYGQKHMHTHAQAYTQSLWQHYACTKETQGSLQQKPPENSDLLPKSLSLSIVICSSKVFLFLLHEEHGVSCHDTPGKEFSTENCLLCSGGVSWCALSTCFLFFLCEPVTFLDCEGCGGRRCLSTDVRVCCHSQCLGGCTGQANSQCLVSSLNHSVT